MPRIFRTLVAHGYYHVINRGNNRSDVFLSPADYRAFLRLIEQAQERIPLRMLAFCIMPNHFHLVVSQDGAKDVSRWMHWLLTTHVHRHHLKYGTSGRVWQGRFKAFPIEQDGHLLTVMRYVERNALRSGLVARAEKWPWGSLACRNHPFDGGLVSAPPMTLPSDWTARVNSPQTPQELEALRAAVNRQRPYKEFATA
jgi:putative transposase